MLVRQFPLGFNLGELVCICFFLPGLPDAARFRLFHSWRRRWYRLPLRATAETEHPNPRPRFVNFHHVRRICSLRDDYLPSHDHSERFALQNRAV